MTNKPHTRGVRVLISVLVLGAVLLAGGCQRTGTISGKVTYKGKALKAGSVTFVTATGTPKPVGIGEDGSYTVAGVPVGPAKILVDTSAFKPEKAASVTPPMGRSAPGGPGGPRPTTPDVSGMPENVRGNPSLSPSRPSTKGEYTAIPDKYMSAETTDLNYTVTPGNQTHDIELKD